MRGFDCSHPAHEDMHLTGGDDEELLRNALEHRNRYHAGEFTDEQIREFVVANAKDE